MKKAKFMMLVVMCVTFFVFASCDDDDDYKPNETLQAALKTKYPNATHIEWEKKKTYLVADCVIDGKDADVWFIADGTWKMTEYELRQVDVPEVIYTTLSGTEYATWRVDDRDLLEYPDKPSVYVIEVEQGAKEYDLYFSPSGELLITKDVSTGDDTHWPE